MNIWDRLCVSALIVAACALVGFRCNDAKQAVCERGVPAQSVEPPRLAETKSECCCKRRPRLLIIQDKPRIVDIPEAKPQRSEGCDDCQCCEDCRCFMDAAKK